MGPTSKEGGWNREGNLGKTGREREKREREGERKGMEGGNGG